MSRYEMKETHQGQEMYDNDLQEYLNTEECIEKMNEMDKANKRLLKFVKDIANHDWDLSEMGAEEVWSGAVELLKEVEE